MNKSPLSSLSLGDSIQRPVATGVMRGLVIEVLPSGQILVGSPHLPDRQLKCDFLESSEVVLSQIDIGDHVLFFCPPGSSEDGVVLGRIGRLNVSSGEPKKKHLKLEAAETVTIGCGDSSLQLRKDGKLMVLSNDLLLRAKRTARIKGGSVAIN